MATCRFLPSISLSGNPRTGAAVRLSGRPRGRQAQAGVVGAPRQEAKAPGVHSCVAPAGRAALLGLCQAWARGATPRSAWVCLPGPAKGTVTPFPRVCHENVSTESPVILEGTWGERGPLVGAEGRRRAGDQKRLLLRGGGGGVPGAGNPTRGRGLQLNLTPGRTRLHGTRRRATLRAAAAGRPCPSPPSAGPARGSRDRYQAKGPCPAGGSRRGALPLSGRPFAQPAALGGGRGGPGVHFQSRSRGLSGSCRRP